MAVLVALSIHMSRPTKRACGLPKFGGYADAIAPRRPPTSLAACVEWGGCIARRCRSGSPIDWHRRSLCSI